MVKSVNEHVQVEHVVCTSVVVVVVDVVVVVVVVVLLEIHTSCFAPGRGLIYGTSSMQGLFLVL